MDKELPKKFWSIVKLGVLVYGILCALQWIDYFFYDFYNKYIYVPSLHNPQMTLGLVLFFVMICLLVLKITHIIKMSGKLSIVMLLLLLSNILLIYLEIRKQGDS
jgi:hypothetical protein